MNRQKTKRWVEAKAISYDGEDWGEVDDFDEYGAQEQEQSPVSPPSNPTGLRQSGQSVESSSPASGTGHSAPLPLSPDRSDKGQGRPFDNNGIDSRLGWERTPSFDRGSEQRMTSVGTFAAPDSSTQGSGMPPTRLSDMDVSHTRDHPSQRYEMMTSGPQQVQGQRRPSAPESLPPLHVQTQHFGQAPSSTFGPASASGSSPREGPSYLSQGASTGQKGQTLDRLPPRKSSLSASDTVSNGRDRTSSNPQKPLPFIRPADIYRRVTEERERERQSLESNRPSMDSLSAGRPSEAEVSSSGNVSGAQASSESLPRSVRHVPSWEAGGNDGEYTKRSKQPLDPVKERRSEYGLEGFSVDEPTSAQALGAPTGPKVAQPISGVATDRGASLTPYEPSSLPPVERISGFGDDLWPSPAHDSPDPSGPMHTTRNTQVTSDKPQSTEESLSASGGLHPAVSQAFDRPDDSSVPETPLSTIGSQRSQRESDPNRSNSASTSGISPIMSRMPGSMKAPPAIAEESTLAQDGRPDSRPTSSAGPADAREVKRKPSPSPRQSSTEVLPILSFIPSHHRKMSSPSPNNSPRKSLAIEENKQSHQGEEGKLVTTTPMDSHSLYLGVDQPIPPAPERAASTGLGSPSQDTKEPSRVNNQNKKSLADESGDTGHPLNGGSSSTGHILQGAAANSAERKGQGWAGDLQPSIPNVGSDPALPTYNMGVGPVKDQIELNRPAVPREPSSLSFRPALPGGWVSYATTADGSSTPASSSAAEVPPPPTSLHNNDGSSVNAFAKEGRPLPETIESLIDKPAAESGISEMDPIPEQASETTAGSTHLQSPPHSSLMSQTRNDSRPPAIDRKVSTNSSVPPTPPPKDTPRDGEFPAMSQEFFPPPVPLKPKHGDQQSPLNLADAQARPRVYPSMNTEPSPQDLESDRLRKEIVKSLSPVTSTFSREDIGGEGSQEAFQGDRAISTNSRVVGKDGEGNFLPSEYETYWNASREDETTPTNVDNSSSRSPEEPSSSSVPMTGETPSQGPADTVPAVSTRDEVEHRPVMLQQRFSWEQETKDPQEETQPPVAIPSQQSNAGISGLSGAVPNPALPSTLSSSAQHPSVPSDRGASPSDETKPIGNPDGQTSTKLNPITDFDDNTAAQDVTKTEGLGETQPGTTPATVAHEEGLELARNSRSEAQIATSDQPRRDDDGSGIGQASRIISNEKEFVDPTESTTKQLPLVDHQAGTPSTVLPNQPKLEPAQSSLGSILAASQPKTIAFREILAMKSAGERIRTFQQARDQLANTEIGLTQWIAMAGAQHPGNINRMSQPGRPVLATQGLPAAAGKGTPTSAVSKPSPVGNQQAQQPYYQQYLNFSNSQSSQGTAIGPSQAGSSGPFETNQGFSPTGISGGKLTSHQVQAKGKDILHTAGVFGGKANVAAKGLFAKGKSRFRGSGGGDKVDY